MKSKNYKYILLFISLTILSTIGLQLYWNVKNYRQNKARLINDVQIALDNSVENYYVEDVKNDFVAFVNNNKSVKNEDFIQSVQMDTLFKKHDTFKELKKNKVKDCLKTSTFIEYKVNSTAQINPSNKKLELDSIKSQFSSFSKINPKSIASLTVFTGKKSVDSISKIKELANRIVISMVRDSIDFKKLNAQLKKELERKKISILYAFEHFKSDSLFEKFEPFKDADLSLKTSSKSTYLPDGQNLKLAFSNPMILILKRSMSEIILSFLLSVSIIFCLLYLLQTISKQKKIDEIKNDLISNITHEFKTPITTIGTAIEGIKNFNSENDVEKTNRYLNISSNQLQKLEGMVERLLETASLDTNQLTIKKDKTDLLPILNNCIEKHQLNNPKKSVVLRCDFSELVVNIDAFHIENAVSNLIDNAMKYGGNTITISLHSDHKNTSILVEDNGIGIDKSLKERIFEKFYRIPKGNIHDVKGFGIGLFYSKKIIEKHGGILELVSHSNPTLFKITLPNEN